MDQHYWILAFLVDVSMIQHIINQSNFTHTVNRLLSPPLTNKPLSFNPLPLPLPFHLFTHYQSINERLYYYCAFTVAIRAQIYIQYSRSSSLSSIDTIFWLFKNAM